MGQRLLEERQNTSALVSPYHARDPHSRGHHLQRVARRRIVVDFYDSSWLGGLRMNATEPTNGSTEPLWARVLWRAACLLVGLGMLKLGLNWPPHGISPLVLETPWRSLLCVMVGAVAAVALWRWGGPVRFFERAKGTHYYGLLGLVGFALYVWSAVGIHEMDARLSDGACYLFQARIFAEGELALPLRHGIYFEQFGAVGREDGLPHTTTMYPPGWPAVLALGVLLGLEWFVNPVLGVLMILVVGGLAREMFDARAGRLAALLCLGSTNLVLLNGSDLSHTLFGLCAAGAAWGVARLVRTGSLAAGLWAGACMGLCVNCRQMATMVVGLCLALWPLLHLRHLRRFWLGAGVAFGVACVGLGVLLNWQKFAYGGWRTTGHKVGMKHDGPLIGYGGVFYTKDGAKGKFTRGVARIHSKMRATLYGNGLMGWPLTSWLLVLLPFLLMRARAREFLLLAPTAGLMIAYNYFGYLEIFYPARYVMDAAPLVFPLGAVGLLALPRRIAPWAWGYCVAGVAFAVGCTLPEHERQFGGVYGDYLPFVDEMEETYGMTNALVFCHAQDPHSHRHTFQLPYYTTLWSRNTLALDGPVVYARNLVDKKFGTNIPLMRVYPDRDFYYLYFYRDTYEWELFRIDREQALQHGKIVVEPLTPWIEGKSRWDPKYYPNNPSYPGPGK